ncbi:PLP-dependent aminotransferase family protein [Mycolicibacterium houstonense]|uniref:MocR-like pyridoxine biosynthesis transcription factor PdxR n=1 Tax=Mycolicibacterium houstonense TaxID=146021 RepID=UPI0021F31CA1|nr:PLP-dependent aminotransferase family protein [Mycolicibacterium houstonense]
MANSGTSSGPELLVELDRHGRQPLHRQLADGLRDAVRSGRLAPGSRLPSTRVLSADLGVSRRLVVEAYGQLSAEGFLHSTQGGCTRVAAVDTVSVPDRALADPGRPRFDIDFAPGSPDLASFPRQAWLRAMRQGLAEIESSEFGYVAAHGLRAARHAVADYLRRTRGVVADPRRIVLCSGATQAVALLAQCLDGPLAMEDPGFWLHRMVLRHNGIDPLHVPVDEDGIDVDALTACDATTVVTTPAHQSPTGVVLSAPRRTELLEWAQPGRLIIEDDYDAEYRYDRAPIGALQGVAPDRVVYIGSTSKTLAPGLRIGWMVLPAHLIARVRTAKSLADTGSSVMDQIAFSQFLTSGAYDRHLRQMRRRYLSRRNALLAALSRHLPRAEVLGAAAGVHLTVRFPAGFPIEELTRRATELRIRLEPLGPCYAEPDTAPPGLILGYANLTESQIARGVEMLGQAARGLGAA